MEIFEKTKDEQWKIVGKCNADESNAFWPLGSLKYNLAEELNKTS